MGLNECSITLDNEQATYHPGQTVSGRVDYIIESPKNINGISIKIKGEAQVLWKTTEHRTSNKRRVAYTVDHRASEEYFNVSYYLIGGKGNEMELPAGTHSYAFACILPPVLPSSYERELGHIRYTVKVTLDRPWKFNKDTRTIFYVITQMDLNTIEQAKLTISTHLKKHFCCCWCKSGPLIVDIGLPVSGFCCGQMMPFDVSVENGSNVGLDSISFILREVATFHCHTPRSNTKTTKMEISKIDTKCVLAHSTVNWIEKLEIPSLPPSNLLNCSIIDLNYEIKVIVHCSGCHIDMDATLPIIIGTVPLSGFQPPPPEGLPVGVPSNGLLNKDRFEGVNFDPPPPYPSYASGSPYHTAPYPTSPMPYSDSKSPYPNTPVPYPNPQVPYPSNPSAPPAMDEVSSQNVFPGLAQHPTQFGTSSIQNPQDNQRPITGGNAFYAPTYPTYGFRIPD